MMMNVYLSLEGAMDEVHKPGSSVYLEKLLAAGSHEFLPGSLQELLCQNFKLSSQIDYPIAAITWLGEHASPHAGFLIKADPVHLVLQRDYFTLAAPAPLPLSRDETQVLQHSLNQHFAVSGLVFEVSPSNQWFLSTTQPYAIMTKSINQVAGRDTRQYMPTGPDVPWANSLVNEIQMLLHEHPVNQLREARGELPVNSLWLSGAGALPTSIAPNNLAMYSNAIFARGLALATQADLHDLPNSSAGIEKAENAVVWLQATDLDQQDWFAQIWQLLQTRKLRELTLNIGMFGMVMQVQLTWLDVWKFWRKPKSVEFYFNKLGHDRQS